LYADDTLLYQEVTDEKDISEFQANINAVYNWSQQWKMPFNTGKCSMIAFGKPDSLPSYKLGGDDVPWVERTKYLGVYLQQNLKFEDHITQKSGKASRILGAIKHVLPSAPEKFRLLAYTSLCRPILEYADCVWDPTSKQLINTIEGVQRRAVRYISSLKGRESVTEARTNLGLNTLEERRKNHRVALLHKILQDKKGNSTLASTYDEILNDRTQSTVTTRAATRGEPTSIYASSRTYRDSFLPRTIRDMRILPDQ